MQRTSTSPQHHPMMHSCIVKLIWKELDKVDCEKPVFLHLVMKRKLRSESEDVGWNWGETLCLTWPARLAFFRGKKDCFAVYCILTSLKDSYCCVPKALTNLTTLWQVLTWKETPQNYPLEPCLTTEGGGKLLPLLWLATTAVKQIG